eukprot:gene30234-biopygen31512
MLWRVAAGRYQMVLGEDSPLREVIFWEAHDSVAAGHTGRDKTLERVLRRFWWKNAANDVAEWAASCPTCQAVRPRVAYPDGSSAQTVARIYFDTVWRQHGDPMKIVCDRDSRFQDAFWKELMRLMGVRVASTTPYNPRSDGQAEHTNKVIEDMLRSFVGANPEDWDRYASNVEFAINDSRSDVTGFTPFELCYGVSRTVCPRWICSWRQLSLPVCDAKEGSGSGNSSTGDTLTESEYAVGDLVWVEARHLTEKPMDRQLCRKKRWHGPLAVVERFHSDVQAALPETDRGAPVAYRLALPAHWRVHDVFAQHRLKPFVQGAEAFATRRQMPIPDPVMVDGQAEAYVEKILAYRVRRVRGKAVDEWNGCGGQGIRQHMTSGERGRRWTAEGKSSS